MSTNYNEEIKIAEKEYQLLSQQNMVKKVELESMRLKLKLEEYEKTGKDLLDAIEVTKKEVKQMKEGNFTLEGGEK